MLNLDSYVAKKTKIKLGGKELTFTKLSLGDLAEFRETLIQQRDIINRQRRERLIEDARKIGSIDPLELLKLTDNSMSEEEIDAQMETIEGITFLAYLSLRYAHAGISQEQVAKIISLENIKDITKAMLPEVEDKKKQKAKQ